MFFVYVAGGLFVAAVLLYICGWGRPNAGTQVSMEEMGARLTAELARADSASRNDALAKIAEEAAAGRLSGFTVTALNAITNPALRDKTAAAGATTLNRIGDVCQAEVIAKMIVDKRLRDETLARLAKSAI